MKIGKSWRIQKLAPYLAESFTEKKLLKNAEELYYQKYDELRNENELLYKYLRFLHDSEILNFSSKDNTIIFTMNDAYIQNFVFSLAEFKKINIDIDKYKFPVTFEFSEITHNSFNKIKRSGIIKRSPQYKSSFLMEYLYDEIISFENNSIELAFIFWAKKLRGRNDYTLLLIKARNFHIVEKQKEVFVSIFGESELDIYNKFSEVRHGDTYYRDGDSMDTFIANYYS